MKIMASFVIGAALVATIAPALAQQAAGQYVALPSVSYTHLTLPTKA